MNSRVVGLIWGCEGLLIRRELMLFLIWDILFFRGCEGLLIRRELNIPGIIKRQCPKFDTNENTSNDYSREYIH